jgi:hypothetical protein
LAASWATSNASTSRSRLTFTIGPGHWKARSLPQPLLGLNKGAFQTLGFIPNPSSGAVASSLNGLGYEL